MESYVGSAQGGSEERLALITHHSTLDITRNVPGHCYFSTLLSTLHLVILDVPLFRTSSQEYTLLRLRDLCTTVSASPVSIPLHKVPNRPWKCCKADCPPEPERTCYTSPLPSGASEHTWGGVCFPMTQIMAGGQHRSQRAPGIEHSCSRYPPSLPLGSLSSSSSGL